MFLFQNIHSFYGSVPNNICGFVSGLHRRYMHCHADGSTAIRIFLSVFLLHSFRPLHNFVSFSLFQLSNEIDSIMLFQSVFCGIWALILVFVTCEFMQRITNSYDAIDDAINNIDWYWVPTNMHLVPIYLISLMYTQKPLQCQFFGTVSCSRDQFRRVRRKRLQFP